MQWIVSHRQFHLYVPCVCLWLTDSAGGEEVVYSGDGGGGSGRRCKTGKASSHSEKVSPMAEGTGSGPLLYIIVFSAYLIMYDK